jgi:hypothetical protein
MLFLPQTKLLPRALNLKNGEVVAVKRIKIDDEDILADIMVGYITLQYLFQRLI